MVAYGNPPYSGVSSNNGKWITNKIEDYKYVDGVHFGERKHWLQDDYVKFIRLAESYVEKNGHGVLAYITNNGYLDNPTFRGMRWHLLNTFDDIYILDLHGNAKKKEIAPDGSPDKNVFDIQQGVAIIIGVKHGNRKEKLAKIHHAELWGDRQHKYNYLWENTLSNIVFRDVKYNAPNFFFTPMNEAGREVYERGFAIDRLMLTNVTGIVTARDALVIGHDVSELVSRIEHFANPLTDDATIRNHYFGNKKADKYEVGDSRGWKLPAARKAIANNHHEALVKPISHRPFDTRQIYYSPDMVDWGREEVMRHMIGGHNLGLICPKQALEEPGGLITNNVIAHKTMSAYNINYLFPLYLYPDASATQTDLVTTASTQRKPNLDEKIVAAIAKKLKLSFVPDHEEKKVDDHSCFSPLDLLDYIYAVLHSPSYRSTYKEFLKIDFPRIPYPADAASFWQLVARGSELRALHLLEHPAIAKPITTYSVGGDNMVEKPTYADGKVHINKDQYFGNVPEVAWNFFIGGYQPAQKWLKDRKGRTLSLDDLRHYQKIIVALTETDRLMGQINSYKI